jgi:hypothetical protein
MTKRYTIEEAAGLLSMSPLALRKRCSRRARRIGSDVVANLGDGVVAVKIGRTWRVRFAA